MTAPKKTRRKIIPPKKQYKSAHGTVLTFKVAGQLAVLGLEREEFRRPAVVVLDDEAGAGRHQHVADAAPLRQGRLVEGRLAAGWGKMRYFNVFRIVSDSELKKLKKLGLII